MRRFDDSSDPFLVAPRWHERGLALLGSAAFLILCCAFILGAIIVFALLLVAWSKIAGRDSLAWIGASPVEWSLAVQVPLECIGAFAATALMARLGGRRLRDFGWSGGRRWRNFFAGTASGLGAMTLLLFALSLTSGVTLTLHGTMGLPLVAYGSLYAAIMLGVAFSEETLFRGYALVMLSRSLSFWPATVVLSLLFGLSHAFNFGETAPGLISAALIGVVLAYSYRRTGSLWFACGFHAAWDFAESFIYGVPNSGIMLPGRLFEARFHGPSWLDGGSAGPEASLLILLVLIGLPWIVSRLVGGGTPQPSAGA